MIGRIQALGFMALLIALVPGVSSAQGLDTDLQMWTTGRVTHLTERNWSFSLQYEIRLADDIKTVDERIFGSSGYLVGGRPNPGSGFQFPLFGRV